MTNEELFAKIRPIVLSITGVPAVELANQEKLKDYKAPTGDYATIWPRQTVIERGQANVYQRDKVGDLVETEVRAQVMATCSVNFYRGKAHEYAERLKQANKHPSVSVALFRAGLGWNGADSVNDLTSLQSANWENRAQITIRLMYEVITITDINNILSASVIIENEKAQQLAEFEVT